MDVHAPEGPVASLKDFFIHVGIITVGVLIALFFEGVTDWFHHRSIAREARESITEEIRDNKRNLAGALKKFPEFEKDQQDLLRKVTALLGHGEPIHELGWHFAGADLRTSSWDTATATGALAYMDYGEVSRYATAYDLQRAYMAMQQRWIETMTGFGLRDPSGVSRQELQSWVQQIGAASTELQVADQIGQHLDDEYAEALRAGN